MMRKLVDIQGLSKKYGSFQALKDISLTLNQGEVLALIGHNGAGKTTLINSIMDLIAYEGNIKYDFERKDLYNNISVQLQNTVFEDTSKVKELCVLYKRLLKSDVNIDELLSDFQLKDKAGAYVKNLSGGEKQKLSILLTLINNPKVVIFDELTTGLDVFARRNIWALLKQLRKNRDISIILTSHFMDEVEFLADRVVILDHGVKKMEGTVDGIIEQCFGTMKKLHFSFDNIEEAKQNLPFEFWTDGIGKCTYEYDNSKEEEIFNVIRKCNAKNIEISQFSFEDAFFKILGYKLTEEGAVENA